MFEKLFNYFNKKTTVEDQFQVRTVIAKNGKKIFFPEYKTKGVGNQWGTIVFLNAKSYKLIDMSTNDPDFCVLTEEEAERYCKAFKDKLTFERGQEFGEETTRSLTV